MPKIIDTKSTKQRYRPNSDFQGTFSFSNTLFVIVGGICEELAKWIIKGKPELDMYGYDIR